MDLAVVIDGAIIGAIVGFVQVIKKLDKAKKFSRLYPLMVLFLGLIAAWSRTDPFVIKTFVYNSLLFCGASVYAYSFGKTTLLGK